MVEKGGDVTHQEDTDGTSALMLVAAHGNVEMIEFLLSEGAVWNAVDRKHKCAGDYATDAGHQVRTVRSRPGLPNGLFYRKRSMQSYNMQLFVK